MCVSIFHIVFHINFRNNKKGKEYSNTKDYAEINRSINTLIKPIMGLCQSFKYKKYNGVIDSIITPSPSTKLVSQKRYGVDHHILHTLFNHRIFRGDIYRR